MKETKICITCKEEKLLEFFHKNKDKPKGRHCVCISCKKIYDKARVRPALTREQKDKANYNKRQRLLIKNGGVLGKPGRKRVSEEHKKQVARKYRNKYRKENKADMLASRLRSRMKKVLIDNMPKNKKSTRTNYSENIGCTGQELVKYIENQWTEGMSWDNYGWGKDKWTIDHIRPISNFLKNGEDPRKANHYTNLRPLWFIENMKKGSKF